MTYRGMKLIGHFQDLLWWGNSHIAATVKLVASIARDKGPIILGKCYLVLPRSIRLEGFERMSIGLSYDT